ncbi:MAG TPA: hydrolase [Bacteroidales bacterium]|jgi:hydroxymethylpyrimidine pyrophosphatase-like HAD family hydrolase|nr:hydrolase [Bacteroidales bacterium]
MIIAVDFDGTIVDHEYPEIGKPKLFAFDTLKALQNKGHQLILWTYRAGKELEEAVEYCQKNGIEFYAINKNYPEEIYDETISRKIYADVYIDDKNAGGFLDWSKIWEILNPELFNDDVKEQMKNIPISKRSFWQKIKRNFGA